MTNIARYSDSRSYICDNVQLYKKLGQYSLYLITNEFIVCKMEEKGIQDCNGMVKISLHV